MKVGSKAPSKEKTVHLERPKRIVTVDKKTILLAQAEQIIRRLSRYKAFLNRPHNDDLLKWLADYEKEMGYEKN